MHYNTIHDNIYGRDSTTAFSQLLRTHIIKDKLHDTYTDQLPCIQLQQVNIDVKLRARLHFKHTVLNVRGHSGL